MKLSLSLLAAAAVATLSAQVVGAPALAAPGDRIQAPVVTELSTTVVMGGTAQFQFSEPAGSVPAVEYVWDLLGATQYRTPAADGITTVPVLAVRFTNVITVQARAADGSFSDSTRVFFNAAIPPPAADQDLNGDGKPDLVTAGGTPGLATGLWQAAGRGTKGLVETPAVNVGVDGTGFGGSFDTAQILTGKFTGGPFEDYMAYFPATGLAAIYDGLGLATAEHPEILPLSEHSGTGAFTNEQGDNPVQVVNAYDSSGNHGEIADVIGIVGSAANGYRLHYYSNAVITGGWGGVDPLTTPTPTGGTDWNNWRLASKLLPNGTAIALWNPTTGGLYLWEGVTFDQAAGRLSYTQYHLAKRWLCGAAVSTLQLTDVNADGVPDLRVVTPSGTVTAYVVSKLSANATAKLTAGVTQRL
jgi:hypothetical protein